MSPLGLIESSCSDGGDGGQLSSLMLVMTVAHSCPLARSVLVPGQIYQVVAR